MSKIIAVTKYECLETGETYDTKEQAQKALRRHQSSVAREKKAREKKAEADRIWSEQSDYVRLHATSCEEVLDLVVKKAKEFWGVDLKVENCGDLTVISRVLSRIKREDVLHPEFFLSLGVIVMSGGNENQSEEFKRRSVNGEWVFDARSIFERGFSGFYLSPFQSGLWGGERPAKFELKIKLSSFPRIMERYEEWYAHSIERRKYLTKISVASHYATRLAGSDQAVRDLMELREYYSRCSEIASEEADRIVRKNYDCFMEKVRSITPSYDIPDHLLEQFGDVP
jgi:hypothetical protein